MAQANGYYDFVLIGKTGMGKSTLGNKLLQIDQIRAQKTVLQRFTSPFAGLLRESTHDYTHGQMRFATTDDVSLSNADLRSNSVTNVCELLANDEIKVRVLDVPGFSDTRFLEKILGKSVTVYDGNVHLVRWIVRIQSEKDLQVRRVVYFLPTRGVPERADANMQDELKVLHHFFGDAIFNCMVVVASNYHRYQKMGFDETCQEDTTVVFHRALKIATRNEGIRCPPIVYIGVAEGSAAVTKKLKSAPVLKDGVLKLKFRDDVCSRCSVSIRKLGEEKIGVFDTTGQLIKPEDTKCHPYFVQKYATWEKFFGGIGHTVTLGTVAIAASIKGSTIWPGFTNSDEVCPACRNSPGSPGCRNAGITVRCNWPNPKKGSMKIEHTNAL